MLIKYGKRIFGKIYEKEIILKINFFICKNDPNFIFGQPFFREASQV
jgi:hypothetical protein